MNSRVHSLSKGVRFSFAGLSSWLPQERRFSMSLAYRSPVEARFGAVCNENLSSLTFPSEAPTTRSRRSIEIPMIRRALKISRLFSWYLFRSWASRSLMVFGLTLSRLSSTTSRFPSDLSLLEALGGLAFFEKLPISSVFGSTWTSARSLSNLTSGGFATGGFAGFANFKLESPTSPVWWLGGIGRFDLPPLAQGGIAACPGAVGSISNSFAETDSLFLSSSSDSRSGSFLSLSAALCRDSPVLPLSDLELFLSTGGNFRSLPS